MNLRFSKGEVRFRIEEAELQVLLAQGSLHERISVPGGSEIQFDIVLKAEGHLELIAKNGACVLLAGKNQVQELTTLPPSKDLGLTEELEGAGGERLKLSLEIDFFTSRTSRKC